MGESPEKAAGAAGKKPFLKGKSYYINCAVGLAIMLVFFIAPPVAPITDLGMKVAGVFLMMVYLWSTVGTLWPSLLGLFLFGVVGAGGDAGFNGVFMSAVGNYIVLMCLFSFILFGALDNCGGSLYIARWLLTRKIFKGRPMVFMAIYMFCSFAMAAFIGAAPAMIVMCPLGLRIAGVLDIQRNDTLWKYFFIGQFLGLTMGQPFFPFQAAAIGPVSTFATITESMGTPMSIPYLSYMIIQLFMTILVIAAYLIFMKVMRVDVSKMKAIDPDMINQQLPLPKMNLQQKSYLIALLVFTLGLLLPGFFTGNPIADFLSFIGVVGVPVIICIVFLVVRYEGKPMLDFREVSHHSLDWGILFMIAAAVYGAGLLSQDRMGITSWLVQALNPILGSQSELGFVAILFTIGVIITSFANNAAMAIVLMPVAITFSNQLGIDPTPVAIGVCLVTFIAILTPSASPYTAMMWANKEIYSPKEILQIGFPMAFIMLALYIFLGYPFAKLVLATIGV